jgi:SAM-dependent methyltransferase
MAAIDPAADVVGIYERYAGVWLRTRGEGGFTERVWLDRFIAQLPQGTTSILDVGCGGGAPIAAYFAEQGYAVTGVDSSPSLLAAFRARLPGHTAINADMRALDLGKRFDGLIAWHSFFHLTFDDQRVMFANFTRHAAPGAVLMFTSGDRHSEAIARMGADPLYHASLAPEEYRALLAQNGFDVLDFRSADQDAGGSAIWLCKAWEA